MLRFLKTKCQGWWKFHSGRIHHKPVLDKLLLWPGDSNRGTKEKSADLEGQSHKFKPHSSTGEKCYARVTGIDHLGTMAIIKYLPVQLTVVESGWKWWINHQTGKPFICWYCDKTSFGIIHNFQPSPICMSVVLIRGTTSFYIRFLIKMLHKSMHFVNDFKPLTRAEILKVKRPKMFSLISVLSDPISLNKKLKIHFQGL